MQFNDWTTQFELMKGHSGFKDAQAFYASLRQRILGMINDLRTSTDEEVENSRSSCAVAFSQASCEAEWLKDGRPYFKLYPDLVRKLLATDITVPSKYVRSFLPSVLLRFPNGHDTPELRDESGSALHSLLIVEYGPGSTYRISELLDDVKRVQERRFIMWMDFGERDIVNDYGKRRSPIVAFQTTVIDDEEASFEENMKKMMSDRFDWDRGVKVPEESFRAAIRVAVGACLLANNARSLLEHDVLNRHQAQYRDSKSEEERNFLHEKAIKRGKKGWLLGREIVLPSRHSGSGQATGTGVKLSHQTLVRGHFRRTLFGPGRSQSRIDWIEPYVKGVDLPQKTERRGYKGEDDVS